MIQDASRRRVQVARSVTIAGRATAVIISSRPARKTPAPRTARRTRASRRGSGSSPECRRCPARRPGSASDQSSGVTLESASRRSSQAPIAIGAMAMRTRVAETITSRNMDGDTVAGLTRRSRPIAAAASRPRAEPCGPGRAGDGSGPFQGPTGGTAGRRHAPATRSPGPSPVRRPIPPAASSRLPVRRRSAAGPPPVRRRCRHLPAALGDRQGVDSQDGHRGGGPRSFRDVTSRSGRAAVITDEPSTSGPGPVPATLVGGRLSGSSAACQQRRWSLAGPVTRPRAGRGGHPRGPGGSHGPGNSRGRRNILAGRVLTRRLRARRINAR